MIFEEIIWLNHIVEKLAWKHRVVPAEVEEVLTLRSTRHFRNQRGKIEGEDISRFFTSKNMAVER